GKAKPPCGGQILQVGVISRAVHGGNPIPIPCQTIGRAKHGQDEVRAQALSLSIRPLSAMLASPAKAGGHRHQVGGRWRKRSTRAPKRKLLPKSNCARPRNTFSRKRVPPTGCQAGLVWPSRRSRSP